MSPKRHATVTVGRKAYPVELEADPDGGWVAEVDGLPGCITDGSTAQGASTVAEDAIRCWLETYEDLKREGIDVLAGRR